MRRNRLLRRHARFVFFLAVFLCRLCFTLLTVDVLLCFSRRALDLAKFPGVKSADPFDTVKPEMAGLVDSIKSLLGVNHPLLSTVAK